MQSWIPVPPLEKVLFITVKRNWNVWLKEESVCNQI
jgi:hypothetical protein